MKNIGEIKKTALNALSGNWGGAVGCSAFELGISYAVSAVIIFIAIFVSIISGSIAAVFPHILRYSHGIHFGAFRSAIIVVVFVVYIGMCLIASIVTSNIYVGRYKFYLNLTSGKKAAIWDIFFTFRNNFWKTFLLYLVMQLKAALWMLLLYIPGCLLVGVGSAMSAFSVSPVGAILIALGFILALASFIPYIMAIMRYAMAPLVFVENMHGGISAAINKSKKLMKGHKGDLFVLYLSFIGWYILSLFTCGIGVLFLSPYVSCSVSIFYNELVGRNTADNSVKYETPVSVFGSIDVNAKSDFKDAPAEENTENTGNTGNYDKSDNELN